MNTILLWIFVIIGMIVVLAIIIIIIGIVQILSGKYFNKTHISGKLHELDFSNLGIELHQLREY